MVLTGAMKVEIMGGHFYQLYLKEYYYDV